MLPGRPVCLRPIRGGSGPGPRGEEVAERKDAAEYLAHGEYGLLIEFVADWLGEDERPVTDEERAELLAVAASWAHRYVIVWHAASLGLRGGAPRAGTERVTEVDPALSAWEVGDIDRRSPVAPLACAFLTFSP